MGPFKDELKLIKGWQTRVQLVWLLSWAKKAKSYGSSFLIPLTFPLTGIIWYQIYVTFTLTMSVSHMSLMWEVLGNLTTGNSWSWCLLQVLRLCLTHTGSNCLKILNLNLWSGVICDLWLGGNVKYEKQQTQWKKYVGINIWFIVTR